MGVNASSFFMEQSLDKIARSAMVPWDAFQGKTVAITGVTGIVGGLLVRVLARHNQISDSDITIIGLARRAEVAKASFANLPGVLIQHWDATSGETLPDADDVDYIIHCASITASAMFLSNPVETILTTVEGTRSLLEYCRGHRSRFCYVSSMEVYGTGADHELTEEAGGAMDSMRLRNCYPEAKQLAEALCAAYAAEYGVGACVARLAQTFGTGVPKTDNRVFAQFAKSCLNGENITLLTDGLKRNMYVATADAATALLLLAAKGQAGESYNVANPETYCSIRQMAQAVAERYGEGKVEVSYVDDPEAARKYPKGGDIRMNIDKLRGLGWEPTSSLMDMYAQLINEWR